MADNNDFGSQSTDLSGDNSWDKDLVADVGAAPIEGLNSPSASPAASPPETASAEAAPEAAIEPSRGPDLSSDDTGGADLNLPVDKNPLNQPVPPPDAEHRTPTEENNMSQPEPSVQVETVPAGIDNDFKPAQETQPEPVVEPQATEQPLPSAEGPMLETNMQPDAGQPAGSEVDNDFLNSLLQMSDSSKEDGEAAVSQSATASEANVEPATPPVATEMPPVSEPQADTPNQGETSDGQAELMERPEEPVASPVTSPPAEALAQEPPVFPDSDQPIDLAHQDGVIEPTSPLVVKKSFPWFWLATGLIVVVGIAIYFLVINRSDSYTSQLPSANTGTPGAPTSTIPESTNSTAKTTSTVTDDQKRQDDLVAIQKGLEQYYLKTKKYPVSVEPSKTSDANATLKVLVSQYLSALPKDPSEPDRYYSYTSADGKTYELTAIFDSLPSGINGVKISTGFMVTLTPGVTFTESTASGGSLSATTAPAAE